MQDSIRRQRVRRRYKPRQQPTVTQGKLREALGRLRTWTHGLPLVAIGATCAALVLGVILAGFVPVTVWGGEGPVEFPEDNEIEAFLAGYVAPREDLDEEADEALERPTSILPALSVVGHRLSEGQTLSVVAARYRLNIDTLVSFNGIRDVRRLAVGAELRVPNQNGIVHAVKRGDTLERIARVYQVDVNRILDVNNLPSSTIVAGSTLFIPGARMRPTDLKRVLGERFIYPAVGRLTSTFGPRTDPFTGIRRFHNGIDLANAVGTPIVAAMAGRVVRLGIHANFGKYIILNHGDGFQTWYAHLDNYAVKTGQRVAQGEKIGEMGNTGYSTGSHLHFSVFRNGAAVDPLRYLH